MAEITVADLRYGITQARLQSLKYPMQSDGNGIVKEIVEGVKQMGDKAVRMYTQKFDGIDLSAFEVSPTEIEQAYRQVDPAIIEAVRRAAQRIERFAQAQREMYRDFTIQEGGMEMGQKVIPLDSVGCYIPGGRFPLLSSALMAVIPARVAGVTDIIVCSPKIHPLTVIAADIAGASQIFRVGGAQAIAAMAYGTESIPKVCKLVGPGNKYVTLAKKMVYGDVGIDFVAGPSEIVVIADDSGNPEFIAADLLAQAEHDPEAIPLLLTTSPHLAAAVDRCLESQIKNLPPDGCASKAMAKGGIAVMESLDDIVAFTNAFAPEHLEIQLTDALSVTERITNYGSLFVGHYAAEVLGDYCAGPNHVLPTNGAAKYSGGLSVGDFLKITTIQKSGEKQALDQNPDQIAGLYELASALAAQEGLIGHQTAAEVRKGELQKRRPR